MNHLNNFRADGKVLFSFEETLFTPSDTRVAPHFLDLETQRTMSFLPTIRLNYYIFLSQLYYVYETHEKYTELIKKEGFSNKYFHY
jgi:hypothetical protein